ncbi:MAG: helix-turn-helix transcriptional regulator [Ruminococcaceae bacterium]|nr:helix-turn-helix transcriptional regulator [Oscillospiraceae bacterium]
MSDIAKTVGKRLRSYRTGQSLSQEKLAERAGLHPTYIGQVERGEKNLTIESLEKITSALDVSMASVFEKIEERGESDNYCLQAYELLSRKNNVDRERLFRILSEIDQYAEK